MDQRKQMASDIIQATDHRPWVLPTGPWAYYQEWNDALFLHWRIAPELLQPLIPKGTSLDLIDGDAWISLVAFTMEKVRPRQLPPWSFVSTFHEVNIRVYVTANQKPGVYFLSLEGGKRQSVQTARFLSGMAYQFASIQRRTKTTACHYTSINRAKGCKLESTFHIGAPIQSKTPLDLFLTEKYCAYFEKKNQLFRYEIQHLPWNLYQVSLQHLVTDYTIAGIKLDRPPELVHYSGGVKVLAWKADKI